MKQVLFLQINYYNKINSIIDRCDYNNLGDNFSVKKHLDQLYILIYAKMCVYVYTYSTITLVHDYMYYIWAICVQHSVKYFHSEIMGL